MTEKNKNTDKQCTIQNVRRSYLDKVKDDLIISKDKFSKCKKHTSKYNFYRKHIEWLESEIEDLS